MDSTTLILIILILSLIGLVGFLFYYFKQKFDLLSKPQQNESLTQWLQSMQGTFDTRLRDMQESMTKTSETLNERVDRSSKSMNERLDMAAHVIGNVQKELGTMSEIGRSMKDLQDFLKSPKLRGNIGEQVLKELLSQMLPSDSYILQHTFRNGERVDAIIKIADNFLCIDSKFPMENFKAMMTSESAELKDGFRRQFMKDIKKHVDDISKKYIVPTEGTLDYALMYIPSESIWYEAVVNNTDLEDYYRIKRVMPLSPNQFFSYLQAIMLGLEGKKVESRAKEILQSIRGIKEESNKFSDNLRVLISHINNSKNKAEEVVKVYERLENKIDGLDRIRGPEQQSLL